MKRLLYALLLISISAISFNCQKEISGGPNPNPGSGGQGAEPITATLQGKIVDENGQPAASVAIKVGSKTTTTDALGFFRITNASLDKKSSVVTAEKTGYFKAYRSFQATSGANHVSIKLIKKTMVGTIISSSGGEVILSNGSKVVLPTDAVVKATGGSYSGTINIYAAYINPTAIDIGQTIPGSFMADDKDGNRVTLASYGMLVVELESGSGEKLQIATGKKATLSAPIPSSLTNAPNTIAMWYVDEQTGIWKEQGSATKNGSNYVGDVSHFSFWNYDQNIPAIDLTLTLKTASGSPLIHTWVTITRPGTQGWLTTYGITDSLGKVGGLVPKNETLFMEVLNDCWSTVYSQNLGPYSQDTDAGVITVNPINSNLVTVKGRLLNCAGNAVTNGYAIVTFNNIPRYASVNASGQFTVSFLRCNTNASTCYVVGVDQGASQQNTVANIPIIAPVTDAGDISACGTTTTQFINITDNSVTYTLSPESTPIDSTYTGTFPLTNGFYTYVNCKNPGVTKSIYFDFNHPNMVPGTFTIPHLTTEANLNYNAIVPSDVTITKFAENIGEYLEGSFSGSYNSQTTGLHNVSGTFRLRRQ